MPTPLASPQALLAQARAWLASLIAPRPPSESNGLRLPAAPEAPAPGELLLAAIATRDLDGLSRALIAGAHCMPDGVDPGISPLTLCAGQGWIAGCALMLPVSGSPSGREGLLRAAQEAHATGNRDLGRLIESRVRNIDQAQPFKASACP